MTLTPGDHRAISAFLDAQAAEAGAAQNTLLAYGRDLRDVSDWLDGRGLSLAELSREMVEDYLTHCDAQGLSRATRARRLSSIRQFTRFALEEGWREDDPAIRIRRRLIAPRWTRCWQPRRRPVAARPNAPATCA